MTRTRCFRRSLPLAAFFLYSAGSHAAPPSTSPYYTDVQNTHVEDATSEGIKQVNNITCYISSMRPDALVNQGNYIALIDSNKCDNSDSASNSGSSSDGSVAPNYQNAILNSTRASNNDPMLVSVWVDNSEGGQQGTIFAHLSATQAPSETDPYGVFRLDFCGVQGTAGPTCVERGYMEAANGQLSFYQDGHGGGGGSGTTALQLTSVGTTSGSGGLTMVQTDNNNNTTTQTFNFAYDSAHFLRGDQCFSRDASDPATGISVWRYGLYDESTGEHVDLNSGFPIQFSSSGTTYQGYVGYYGLSLPAPAMSSISNGSTVQKVDYSSNGGAPTLTDYTLRTAGGKLTKFTRKSTDLHAIDQVVLNAFVNDTTNFFSGATPNTQYELHWDDASGNFIVTGQVDCSNNGCQTHEYDTPQTVAATFWALNGLQGWSQSLGGDIFIDVRGASLPLVSVNVPVVYHAQSMVYPADMPADLYCASNCPTSASLQGFFAAQPQTSSSPFDGSTYMQAPGGTALIHYSADTTNGLLLDDSSQAVVYTDSQAYQQYSQWQNGINTGHLVTSTAGLECTPGSGTYCDSSANDADVYYAWQTGPNNWNQFAAVADANNQFVQFDAPLQMTYNVPNTTAFGNYAGKSIVLQYGGFGNLWGIPGICVSSQTNATESCDQSDARFVPQFVIPDDLTTGTVSDGTHTYLVKWLDREIRFANKDISECSALTAPTNVTLPTASDLQNPSDPASPIYIGSVPTVTDAPRVISGEIEY